MSFYRVNVSLLAFRDGDGRLRSFGRGTKVALSYLEARDYGSALSPWDPVAEEPVAAVFEPNDRREQARALLLAAPKLKAAEFIEAVNRTGILSVRAISKASAITLLQGVVNA